MEIAAVNRAESKNLHIFEIQDGGRPPYWKLKIRRISATVHPIKTKFCMNMQIWAANKGEG